MTQLSKSISATSPSADSAAALLRLQQARTHLMLHYPFYSVLALSLTFEESSATKSMATDGSAIYWNSEFVLELNPKQLASVIAHECLHVAFCHHLRAGNKDHYFFNVATDYAINYILIESGLCDLPGGLYDAKYKGWSAEQIYLDIYEPEDTEDPEDQDGQENGDDGDDGEDTQDGDTQDGDTQEGDGDGDGDGDDDGGDDGDGDDTPGRQLPVGEVWAATVREEGDRPLTPQEISEEESKIAERVFIAHAEERAAGNGSPGAFRGVLEDKRSGDVPWNEIIMAHLQDLIVSDTSFERPNRRFIHQGLVLPGNVRKPNGVIVYVFDTSGSQTDEDLKIASGHCQEIAEIFEPSEIIVIYCDDTVKKIDRFDYGDEIQLKAYGGGGTDFAPPFNWLVKEEIEPDVLVYFTDGYGTVGGWCRLDEDPTYPVIWASTGCMPRFAGGVEEFGELVEIGRIF